MTMDFFERQDHARRLTRRLVVMFALSVVVVVLIVYLVTAVLVVHLSPAARTVLHNGRWATNQYDRYSTGYPQPLPEAAARPYFGSRSCSSGSRWARWR